MASLIAQSVKNLPAMQETRVQSLGGKESVFGREGMFFIGNLFIVWKEPVVRLKGSCLPTSEVCIAKYYQGCGF